MHVEVAFLPLPPDVGLMLLGLITPWQGIEWGRGAERRRIVARIRGRARVYVAFRVSFKVWD